MRIPRIIVSVALLCSALVAVQITPASASGCGNAQKQLASMTGVGCHKWHHIKRDGFGKLMGGEIHTNHDVLLTAPRHGRIDFASKHDYLWSTKNVTRRVWLRDATYWLDGLRGAKNGFPLSRTPRSPSMARQLLIKSGDASVVRKQGSESTGWFITAKGHVVFKTVYHGRMDTPAPGSPFNKGQKPPALEDGEQATFWYNG
ncbi:MAG: hypothetical protein AAB520_00435 [Patescibacteria group bacterium]